MRFAPATYRLLRDAGLQLGLVGEKVQLELTHDPSLGPVRADKR